MLETVPATVHTIGASEGGAAIVIDESRFEEHCRKVDERDKRDKGSRAKDIYVSMRSTQCLFMIHSRYVSWLMRQHPSARP